MKRLFILFIFFITNSYASEYTIGIIPQYDEDIIKQKWTPLLHYMSTRLGETFVLKFSNSMCEFDENLKNGLFDFAYANPHQYVIVNRTIGYRAILKIKNQRLRGIIVMNNNAVLKTLSELDGKDMAFPYKEAFAAYQMLNNFLLKEHITINPVFVGSHQCVYEAVASGLFIAGGGIMQTFEASSFDIKNKLDIKYVSPEYSSLVILAHPRVPCNLVQNIITILSEMDSNENDKIYLELLSFDGFSKTNETDFDEVRKLVFKQPNRNTE